MLFNLITRRLEKANNMLYPRLNHSLISCGNFIYAIGGVASKIVKECEKFSLLKKE